MRSYPPRGTYAHGAMSHVPGCRVQKLGARKCAPRHGIVGAMAGRIKVRYSDFEKHMNASERFLQYVGMPTESGCRLWSGYSVETDTGPRGRFYYKGRNQWAPRVAFLLFKGPLAPNEKACHTCDVGLCVEPSHLFKGSDADNAADKVRKGRAYRASQVQTHCKRGHEFDAENTKWILHRRGHMYRQCRICLKILWDKHNARKRKRVAS